MRWHGVADDVLKMFSLPILLYETQAAQCRCFCTVQRPGPQREWMARRQSSRMQCPWVHTCNVHVTSLPSCHQVDRLHYEWVCEVHHKRHYTAPEIRSFCLRGSHLDVPASTVLGMCYAVRDGTAPDPACTTWLHQLCTELGGYRTGPDGEQLLWLPGYTSDDITQLNPLSLHLMHLRPKRETHLRCYQSGTFWK